MGDNNDVVIELDSDDDSEKTVPFVPIKKESFVKDTNVSQQDKLNFVLKWMSEKQYLPTSSDIKPDSVKQEKENDLGTPSLSSISESEIDFLTYDDITPSLPLTSQLSSPEKKKKKQVAVSSVEVQTEISTRNASTETSPPPKTFECGIQTKKIETVTRGTQVHFAMEPSEPSTSVASKVSMSDLSCLNKDEPNKEIIHKDNKFVRYAALYLSILQQEAFLKDEGLTMGDTQIGPLLSINKMLVVTKAKAALAKELAELNVKELCGLIEKYVNSDGGSTAEWIEDFVGEALKGLEREVNRTESDVQKTELPLKSPVYGDLAPDELTNQTANSSDEAPEKPMTEIPVDSLSAHLMKELFDYSPSENERTVDSMGEEADVLETIEALALGGVEAQASGTVEAQTSESVEDQRLESNGSNIAAIKVRQDLLPTSVNAHPNVAFAEYQPVSNVQQVQQQNINRMLMNNQIYRMPHLPEMQQICPTNVPLHQYFQRSQGQQLQFPTLPQVSAATLQTSIQALDPLIMIQNPSPAAPGMLLASSQRNPWPQSLPYDVPQINAPNQLQMLPPPLLAYPPQQSSYNAQMLQMFPTLQQQGPPPVYQSQTQPTSPMNKPQSRKRRESKNSSNNTPSKRRTSTSSTETPPKQLCQNLPVEESTLQNQPIGPSVRPSTTQPPVDHDALGRIQQQLNTLGTAISAENVVQTVPLSQPEQMPSTSEMNSVISSSCPSNQQLQFTSVASTSPANVTSTTSPRCSSDSQDAGKMPPPQCYRLLRTSLDSYTLVKTDSNDGQRITSPDIVQCNKGQDASDNAVHTKDKEDLTGKKSLTDTKKRSPVVSKEQIQKASVRKKIHRKGANHLWKTKEMSKKLHKCIYCDKTSNDKFYIMQHIANHFGSFGSRIFACTAPECTVSYNWYTGLYIHVKRKHPEMRVPAMKTYYKLLKSFILKKNKEYHENLHNVPESGLDCFNKNGL
ncbi:uncharacterized protein LOC129788956 isoform X3 [Lutzomyia longipalpis]|uniref:uncharacterized protein LOC129788956 isoform X3 n=1 Tax=Lutzomyia longipalpis TaxID=7200 RepID=UPI0024842246|nr:uncharacterized protein LOC129788956 isoform X3 [Lutzomyia longipalpis]